HGDVPFIAHPRILLPPVARRAPGAGGPEYFSGNPPTFTRHDMRGLAFAVAHSHGNRRTQNSQRGDNFTVVIVWGRTPSPGGKMSTISFRGFGWHETAHLKSFTAMRVQQNRRPHASFTHYSRNSCQRELELFRFGRNRHEQSVLSRTRLCRLNSQTYFRNRSARRIRFQIQLQKFEKSFGVEQRHRKAKDSLKLGECRMGFASPIFKRQFQMQFLSRQRSSL